MTARSTPIRPEAVRRKIEAWLAEQDETSAIALAARPEWDSEPLLTVNGVTVRVVPCPTPLAARAALHDRADAERLVLLTELPDSELGDGVLAHVSKQTVRSVDRWDLVRQMFAVTNLDPSLVRTGRWVADALSDHTPPGGWAPPTGSLLTRDHALRCLTVELLFGDRDTPDSSDLRRGSLDSSGLLQWSLDPAAQLRFTKLPAEVADGVTAYLKDIAGDAAVPIMAAACAGHGVDAIPLGLLATVLWPRGNGDTPSVESQVARARLEPRFGGARLTTKQGEAFGEAAEAWIYRAFDSGPESRREAVRLLRRAETIAAEIDIVGLLGASTVLPSGLTQRLRAFAAAVRLALPSGGTANGNLVAEAQTALNLVEEHRAAERGRVETARMAVRLLRWLATVDDTAPVTLLDALHRQVRHDGWVDRARLDLFAGDPDPQVAEAYQLLHRAVDARRARHDRQFADLLAAATRAEAEPGALLRVEDLLDRVVQPVVDSGRRVLLLVLDGMGMAAATELAESLLAPAQWVELTPGGAERTGVLAALPTVTEVSRCSLLTGRIAVGGQSTEKNAFEERFPGSRLLHKKELRAAAGSALDPDVRAALGNPGTPVVAAVVNTIDDALERGEPGTAVWGQETITAVGDLLAFAQDRVVIIVSDHGHVVDRGPEAVVRPGGDGANRWRPATSPPDDGEVLASGSRVGLGGGSVVLPWREELRYGSRKAGYHGGAAPAEAVIPLLMFSTTETAVAGWSGAPVSSPDWWREALPEPAPAPTAAPVRRPRQRRPAEQSESLFELLAVPADASAAAPPAAAAEPPAPAAPTLVDALLASDRYAQRRGTRTPLPDERVAALVGALLGGGGRATLDTLAARSGVPAHRIGGAITALRRLLQVEGYPVVTLDPDGRTVLLDKELLVEQFDLEQP
ncbi:MAG TPA: BREX-2 system phosphatase PglZ [Micromonospora sp.]|nr:BREX-2 system phosphatase PglZ [Micromonospora sp.]